MVTAPPSLLPCAGSSNQYLKWSSDALMASATCCGDSCIARAEQIEQVGEAQQIGHVEVGGLLEIADVLGAVVAENRTPPIEQRSGVAEAERIEQEIRIHAEEHTAPPCHEVRALLAAVCGRAPYSSSGS